MEENSEAGTLVPAVLQEDEAAARELVRRLHPLVSKLVRSHRPRRAAEEDLCQMIFIKIFQKLPQWSGKVPLEHWVSRVAINTCLNQIQSEKVRPELRYADLTEEEVAVVQNLASTPAELAPGMNFAARDLVEHLLRPLQPRERLVIDLFYLQQLTVAEIQERTGWNASLVKVRAFRARQKMRLQLARLSVRGEE
ncbi:MAG: RNA polymerase sigma factor [Chthoniobacterales bacterium]